MTVTGPDSVSDEFISAFGVGGNDSFQLSAIEIPVPFADDSDYIIDSGVAVFIQGQVEFIPAVPQNKREELADSYVPFVHPSKVSKKRYRCHKYIITGRCKNGMADSRGSGCPDVDEDCSEIPTLYPDRRHGGKAAGDSDLEKRNKTN